jgi:hypothetical protein
VSARAPIPTAIGRAIDLSYRSNRLAVAIAAVAGLAGGIVGVVTSTGWDIAIEAAVWAGASLAAWVTARELDHDDPRGATVAAVLAPLAVWWAGRPAFLAAVALIMAARIALRSTGLVPSILDQVGLIGLGLLAAGPTAGWVAAMVLAVALARDGARSTGAAPWGRVFGFVLALGATARHLVWGDAFAIGGDAMVPALVASAMAVVAAALGPRQPPTVPCDAIETPPAGSDAFVARLLVVIGAAAGALVAADPAATIPATAALLGVALATRLGSGR